MSPPLSPALVELLSSTPAMPPPPGVTPNFIDPPNQGQTLLILNVIFLPLMIMAVVMRMSVKGIFVRNLGWDDYTCAIAAGCSVIHSACIFSSLNYGFGKHLYDIPAIAVIDPNHIRQLTSSTIAYPCVIFAVKLSILLLYRRVFTIDKILHYGTIIGIVMVCIMQIPYIGTQMYTVIHCATPHSLYSNPFCEHLYDINVSQSAVNLMTDFYILILPLPRLMKLNLPLRRKIGLCLVFAAGFVTCIVSIVRLVVMVKTLSLEDYTWNTCVTIELSVVEVNVAIICACMTTLPPFLAKSKLFITSMRSKYASSGTRNTSISWSRKASKQSSDWSSRNGSHSVGTIQIPVHAQMPPPEKAYVPGAGNWVRLDDIRVEREVRVDWDREEDVGKREIPSSRVDWDRERGNEMRRNREMLRGRERDEEEALPRHVGFLHHGL